MRPGFFALLMLLVALFAPFSSSARAQPALVFDIDTGQVLIAEEAGRPWYPASLTKLMTAYLTLQAINTGKLRLNQTITISKHASIAGGRKAARYGAKPGQKMTVDYVLSYLLVRSGADMAVALAEAVAGSEARFVKMMNATARRLGMTGTRFANPHGMHDPAQVTTARDMGMLAMAIHHHFLKQKTAWQRFFSAPYIKKGKHKQKNRNKLLFMMKGANGMKTGFLCRSGFNLLATARRGGRTLAAVVFGRKTAYTRASFARVLLEEGFRVLAQGGRTGVVVPQIRNLNRPPPDLTASVCRRRTVHMAELERPDGWGVALGEYRGAVNAEATLEGELLAARLLHRQLPRGVVRLPKTRSYAGLVWWLDQRSALALCNRAKVHGVTCATYPPEALTKLALAVKAEREARKAKAAKRVSKRKKKIARKSNLASRRRRASAK